MTLTLEPEPKQESTYGLQSLHRVPAQFLKGVGTKVAGEFGDIPGFVQDVIANPIVKASGGEDVPYEESTIGKVLPTTYQHQKKVEAAVPYLKPKNSVEKFANDLGQDITSLFLPSRYMRVAGRLANAVPSLIKSTAVALGAGLVGEGVKQWSGDEQKGNMAKSGSMLLFNMFNPGGAREIERNLYQQRDRLLPAGARVNTNRLSTDLTRRRNDILGNRHVQDLSENERFVINEIDKVLRNVQGGTVEVADIVRMRRSLYDSLEGSVYNAPPGETRRALRRMAEPIGGDLNQTLDLYGRTNPRWLQAQRSADQAHGAIQGSNFVSRIIKNHVSPGSISPALMHLLVGVPAGAGAIIPYAATKVGYQTLRSPELRRHYANVVRNALQGNIPEMQKNIQKLDEQTKKMEKSETFTLED